MGFLKSLFGGDSSSSQRRDDYNIAVSPYADWYNKSVQAAQPVDQSFSAGFANRYTNLGREQAALRAQQQYQTALSPAYMRSAAGRQAAAGAVAQTRAGLAREESANRMGLEQAQIGLAQQNWQNRMAYAGLRGQQAGFGAQQAGVNYQMQESAAQAKQAGRQQLLGLGVGIAGSLLGPSVAGLGGKLASSLNLGIGGSTVSTAANSAAGMGSALQFQPRLGNAFSAYARAAGTPAGMVDRGNVMVGDGGAAPELILNPTGAPLTVVPLTGKQTSRWVSMDSMMPARVEQRKQAFDYLPRYACGGKTVRPAFIAGEGR